MVLIISSPISSHVKQKEGGHAAIRRHTLYPSVELSAAPRRLRGLGQRKISVQAFAKGRRRNSDITASPI